MNIETKGGEPAGERARFNAHFKYGFESEFYEKQAWETWCAALQSKACASVGEPVAWDHRVTFQNGAKSDVDVLNRSGEHPYANDERPEYRNATVVSVPLVAALASPAPSVGELVTITSEASLFEQRKAQGYAPGGYMCECSRCASMFQGDKRACCCEACADKAIATPPLAPAVTGASKPFAYYIHIAAEQRGEFVHDLDEALDDLTNCDCKITELFDHATPPAAPAVTEGAKFKTLRTGAQFRFKPDGPIFLRDKSFFRTLPDGDNGRAYPADMNATVYPVLAAPAAAVPESPAAKVAREPSHDEKRKLIDSFFGDEWAVEQALKLLDDYHRLVAPVTEAPAATEAPTLTDEQIIAEALNQGMWMVQGWSQDGTFITTTGRWLIDTVRALATPAPAVGASRGPMLAGGVSALFAKAMHFSGEVSKSEDGTHSITMTDAQLEGFFDAAVGASVQPVQARLSDTQRLDALRENSWDLRCIDVPTGGGDSDIHWRVVEHHMTEPHERDVGRCYRDEPRDAIDDALASSTPTKGGASS